MSRTIMQFLSLTLPPDKFISVLWLADRMPSFENWLLFFWLLDSQVSSPAEQTRSPSSAFSCSGSLIVHHFPSLRTVLLTLWPVQGMGQPCCSHKKWMILTPLLTYSRKHGLVHQWSVLEFSVCVTLSDSLMIPWLVSCFLIWNSKNLSQTSQFMSPKVKNAGCLVTFVFLLRDSHGERDKERTQILHFHFVLIFSLNSYFILHSI